MQPEARSHKTVQPTASRPHVGLACWRTCGAKTNSQPLDEKHKQSHTLQARHTRAACRAACRTSASSSRWHSTYGTRMRERWGEAEGTEDSAILSEYMVFFPPMVHSLVRSSRRWTGNVPVQNTRGCFPTLFILVLLPEGEGIVRLSSKTSCSGPQLFSSQQNKGCGKFINVRYVG